MPTASQLDQLSSAVSPLIRSVATFSPASGGVGRISHGLLVRVILIIHACSLSAVAWSAYDEPADEAAAIQTYQQFLKVLLRNPRFGTAYDRVYEFHSNRGTIQAFHDALADVAGLPELKASAEAVTDSVLPEFTALPDPGVASVLVGMLALQHVEGADAVIALERATQLRREDAVAHWYLGKARIINHQLDLAAESFERAILCRPVKTDLFEIYKDLARTLQRSQQDALALSAWQRLEHVFPGDLRVKEQIAVALAQDGRWQDALARYEALARESKNPEQRVQANLAAADLMIQLGRPQDAIALLESQLATLDVDSWLYREIRRRIESVFRSRDDLTGLVAYYETWIRGHAEDIDAMARLGRTLSLQNQTALAAEWYRKAISLAPSNIALRESLIEQLVRDNQSSDAIAQYEQMAEFDAGNRDHIEDWGQLYLSRKDLPLPERQAKAAAIWERLIVERPDDPAALSRLAELMRRAELSDRAIELYRQAIDKAPHEPQYREYLGEFLHRLQRTDEALAVWKQIAAGDRRSKANLIRLAEVLHRFGQADQALAAMRDACSLDPDPAERMQFAEMLRESAEINGTRESSEAPPTDENPDRGLTPSAANRSTKPMLTEALEQLELAERSAETPGEREQILGDRVKTLIAAGLLEKHTTLLAAELNIGTNVTAERWRRLALYQTAADKLNDATASAIRVVELESQSIPGWTILADLYERTGRPGDAADAMKKLAALDRRGISEYLRKIARFEIRLGQFDAALKTGRDVIKATPGNPEAYQFFADLAFEVGQPQAAVEALRQAVRVNPGDETSLRALAKTLADEFQTPEAIELYWRAFEKASDLESQTNIVVALSNLYLRSNQFEKLIERLEMRSRQLNLPAETTRCIATAYREAGDFRKSRETLERLMIDDSQNISLLKELTVLAQQEHNKKQVEQYQRQIVDLTQADEERRRLVEILADANRYDEAKQELVRLAESRIHRPEILKEIDFLIAAGHEEIAVILCQRLLKSSSDDWEALNAYRGILLREFRYAEARDVCRRILQLDLDFDTPATASSPAQNFGGPPAQRMDTAESISDWLLESTVDPGASFGAVYCDCAGALIFRVGGSASREDIASVFAAQISDRDNFRLAAYLIRAVTARTPASSEVWTALEDFLSGPPGPERAAIQLFAACQRYAADDLPADDLQRLKQRSVQLLKTIITEAPSWLNQRGMPILNLMPEGEADPELAAIVEQQLTVAKEIRELRALWDITGTFQSPELIRKNFAVLHRRITEEPAFAAVFEAAISESESGFGDQNFMALRLHNDPEALVSLLDLYQMSGASIDRSSRQSSSSSALTLPQILINQFGEPFGRYLSDGLKLLLVLNAEDRVAGWLRAKAASASPGERVNLSLIRAELARQLGEDMAEIAALIDAAEGDPRNHDVRFLIADKAAKLGLTEEAILLLDSMNLTDAPHQIARESFVLRCLFPQGRSERCIIAADRLFGLPQDMARQRELIPFLEKLGMHDKVAAMKARFGRGAETRQSILGKQLQTYAAQGKNELAGEVAWELLKLASGGSLFSGHRPGDDRDDGGERLQAIKALGRLNRLQPLIDRYEAMLAAAPDSVELLEILAEFHDAAEQWDLLVAKRDRIALLSKKAPPSLRAKATELERSGDVSGACDIYLTILKDDPEAFSEEMETYVQAFERASRHADFLTAVLSVDKKYWTEHAGLLINVIAELARMKSNDELVRTSIETMLTIGETRRLTIAGFLIRPDVIAEDVLVPAILKEFAEGNVSSDPSTCNELFLMLQGLKKDASLQAVQDSLTEQGSRGLGPDGTRVPGIYLDARLGKHAEAESRLEQLLSDTDSGAEVFELIALNLRLKELGDEWNEMRLRLLERLSQRLAESPDLAESILEELGAVYEALGRLKEARGVLNQRIQRLFLSTGASRGNASESVRQLLQAGESIQHSGFPIEGARLLLSVTAHDIDVFTSDLNDDKAVAFKSRFNASQRWARQQIAADKLVMWFDAAVQTLADDRSESDLDLLLEISGTTDPRCHDAGLMKTARMDSVILKAIEKQAFGDEKQQLMLKESIRTLLAEEHPPASLLTAALAFVSRMNDEELKAAVVEKLNSLPGPEAPDGLSRAAERSPGSKIPEALRSAPDLAVVFAAKMLLPSDAHPDAGRRLLQLAAAKATSSHNHLVRIAVLNECLAAATQSKLADLATALESARDLMIVEQIAAVSLDTPGSIDLRQEIRTRLLKLKDP